MCTQHICFNTNTSPLSRSVPARSALTLLGPWCCSCPSSWSSWAWATRPGSSTATCCSR
jgi:hypothetical protein